MALEAKLDLMKMFAGEYKATRVPARVTVSTASYLCVEGQGSPDSPLFAESAAALFQAAYGIKKRYKAQGQDYGIPKLEALWWSDDDSDSFLEQDKEIWRWQLLNRLPAFVSAPEATPLLDGTLRIMPLEEGSCVQMLHIGPYASVMETVTAMWGWCHERGLVFDGKHHEVYLSDPRKTAHRSLRTLVRYPVRSFVSC